MCASPGPSGCSEHRFTPVVTTWTRRPGRNRGPHSLFPPNDSVTLLSVHAAIVQRRNFKPPETWTQLVSGSAQPRLSICAHGSSEPSPLPCRGLSPCMCRRVLVLPAEHVLVTTCQQVALRPQRWRCPLRASLVPGAVRMRGWGRLSVVGGPLPRAHGAGDPRAPGRPPVHR